MDTEQRQSIVKISLELINTAQLSLSSHQSHCLVFHLDRLDQPRKRSTLSHHKIDRSTSLFHRTDRASQRRNQLTFEKPIFSASHSINMNIEIVFSLSNQSPPTCLTSLKSPAFFPLVNRMMLLPLLLKEKEKGIMLVGQVVQAVLAATLVFLQVILIAIVPLLLDWMQGIHLGLEWIQLSILMSFCCNIYTRHNPLQCLGLLMSILNFKFSPGQPSSISNDEGVTLVGSGQDAANLINQKEIHWGIFPQ